MARAFHFMTRLNLVELLGRQAKNTRELFAGLQEVPGSSIYYHTHRSRLDPYTITLEGLREMIVQKVGEYIKD